MPAESQRPIGSGFSRYGNNNNTSRILVKHMLVDDSTHSLEGTKGVPRNGGRE